MSKSKKSKPKKTARAIGGKAPVETAAQKLKRISDLVDRITSPLTEEVTHDGLGDFLHDVFSILHPGRALIRHRNGVPFAKEDAASHIEGTEFGA